MLFGFFVAMLGVIAFITLPYYFSIWLPADGSKGHLWGLLLMFIALCTNILKEEMIRESARWLVDILPFLFVAPTVNLMDSADMLLPDLLPVLVIIPVTSLITFLVSGKTVQRFMIKEEGRDKYE